METQENKTSQRKTSQEAQEQAEINYRLKRLRELYKLDKKKGGC